LRDFEGNENDTSYNVTSGCSSTQSGAGLRKFRAARRIYLCNAARVQHGAVSLGVPAPCGAEWGCSMIYTTRTTARPSITYITAISRAARRAAWACIRPQSIILADIIAARQQAVTRHYSKGGY